MKIVTDKLTMAELKQMAVLFDNMVKAVVDLEKEAIAVDAELHSDLEALLLENGSKQKNLWGINLLLEKKEDEFVQFDSMINMRPSQNNKSRGVESADTRKKIIDVVVKRVKP